MELKRPYQQSELNMVDKRGRYLSEGALVITKKNTQQQQKKPNV